MYSFVTFSNRQGQNEANYVLLSKILPLIKSFSNFDSSSFVL